MEYLSWPVVPVVVPVAAVAEPAVASAVPPVLTNCWCSALAEVSDQSHMASWG